jgi:hypothetical protein
MFGTPFTQALHVVERYRLLDYEAVKAWDERSEREYRGGERSDPGFARNPGYKGKGLQLEFTVEDEGVFTTRWSARIITSVRWANGRKWPAPKTRTDFSRERKPRFRLRTSLISKGATDAAEHACGAPHLIFQP